MPGWRRDPPHMLWRVHACAARHRSHTESIASSFFQSEIGRWDELLHVYIPHHGAAVRLLPASSVRPYGLHAEPQPNKGGQVLGVQFALRRRMKGARCPVATDSARRAAAAPCAPMLLCAKRRFIPQLMWECNSSRRACVWLLMELLPARMPTS
jgi:hypothetical protein